MKLSRKNKDVPERRRTSSEPVKSELDKGAEWRRNRTISGVNRGKDGSSESPRSKAHGLVQRRRNIGGILVLVVGVCLVLIFLIFQFTARVLVTSSSRDIVKPVDDVVYRNIINDYFGVNPATRLRFLLDEADMSDYISTIAAEVDKVEQSGSENIVDTRFKITFRKPIAGWQINNRQYFVDQHGVVFENNYYASPTVQIIDESNISPEEGSTVASERLLSFVGRVVALAGEGGYKVVEVVLPSGTTRQIEVKLEGTTSLVKMSIDRGAGEQVEDMVRSLRYLKEHGQAPGYIDVRVSGRAVYQ